MSSSFPHSRKKFWSTPVFKYTVTALASLLIVSQLVHHQTPLRAAWTRASANLDSDHEPNVDPAARPAGNSTMGFEKIIVINLDQRGDRRDRMSLLSAHTGIDIEYSPGVKGEQVDPKSTPAHWDTNPSLVMGNLGSYRSHMLAIRQVVEKGYRTALIMEDDLDWDLGIKSQLPLFASNLGRVTRSGWTPLSKQASHQTPNAPYGLDWDILWLGTCMRPEPPADAHSYRDPISEEEMKVWDTKGGVACSHAYGITYESAKAILAYGLDLNSPWDLHLSEFCEAHVCPLVSPPIIGFHQAAGALSKGSDISPTDGAEVREQGISIGVKHSALLDVTNDLLPKKEFPPIQPATQQRDRKGEIRDWTG